MLAHNLQNWEPKVFDNSRTSDVFDATLQKISVPFILLQAILEKNIQETKIKLNAFSAEITHALLTTEKAAIPAGKIHKCTEISGFSKNQELVKACQDAKYWLTVWRERGNPKSGVLNSLCWPKHA